MSGWTNDELNRIGEAEELNLSPVRRDGTLREPVTMWVVRNGEDVYVRSVNGRTSSWFRGAQIRHEAHIQAGGVEKDVRPSRLRTSMTSSMPSTAPSTGATPRASSTTSLARKREPPP